MTMSICTTNLVEAAEVIAQAEELKEAKITYYSYIQFANTRMEDSVQTKIRTNTNENLSDFSTIGSSDELKFSPLKTHCLIHEMHVSEVLDL